MSLDVYVLELKKFPENYKAYDEISAVQHLSKSQADYLNDIVEGCAVPDDYEYLDIYGYAKENNLDINGFQFINVHGDEFVNLQLWDDHLGWHTHGILKSEFKPLPYDGTYIVHVDNIESMGGGEMFTEDHPYNIFTSKKDLMIFKKYLNKDFTHGFDHIKNNSVIYLEY